MYPSSLRRRAISTFIRELGMVACSCSALLALRMRVSMSAIGSVSTVSLLPARLRHAGNRSLVRELAEADPAEAELAEHRTRAAAPVAARVVAHLELLGSPLFHDERRLGHYCSLLSPSANGSPSARSSARACSSFWALVVIVTSSPRTCWMSS